LRNQAELIYGAEDRASHEEGIFQSIGYKEFAGIPTSELSPDHPLFKPAVERMKLSTRQYAKKQLKWIKKQLLPAVKKAKSQGGEVYVYVLKAGESKDGRKLLEGLSFSEKRKRRVQLTFGTIQHLLAAMPCQSLNLSVVRVRRVC
jgi:tRNA A37 N6-isopentenylltransferase MiaA